MINSGTTSEAFHLGRRIRQGCCASPFLFNLAIELLAALIRSNRNIRGIALGKEEVKLLQFADDLTCLLADEQSLSELITTLWKFSTWSGLEINKRKPKIISPGEVLRGESTLQGMTVTNKAKILTSQLTSQRIAHTSVTSREFWKRYKKHVTHGTTKASH